MNARVKDLDWRLAVGTGTTRILAGAALLRWRRSLIRLSGGTDTDRRSRLLFTYFGVRDVALGVSALAATRPGGDVSKQLALQGAADATDTVLLRRAVRRGRLTGWRGHGVVALAAGTAIADGASLVQLKRHR